MTTQTLNAHGDIVQTSTTTTSTTFGASGQTANSSYVPLPGGATEFESTASGGNHHFWHKDWLGSVRFSSAVTNRNSIADRAFAPFGEMYDNFGAANELSFAGDTQDSVSGTYDTPNRELNPNQGRWLSPDPAGVTAAIPRNPQSWSRYAYVQDDPLSNVDPTGLSCQPGQKGDNQTGDCPGRDNTSGPETKNQQAQNTSSCGFWCKIGQALGFVETDAEKKAAAGQRDWINRNVTTRKDGKPPDTSHMSDRQVTNYYNMIMMGLMMGRIPIAGSSGPGAPNYQTDPAQSPGSGWEWRGKGPVGSSEGSWYNAGTNESFHPDLSHPDPIGPHYDYRDALGNDYRVFPDGTVVPK